MTGKQYSVTLRLSEPLLAQLRKRLGDLEDTFRTATGHGFDRLTESEARMLVSYGPLERVRARIVEAAITRGDGLGTLNEGQGDSSLGSSPAPDGAEFAAQATAELAKHDEIFRYRVSSKFSLRSVMADVFPRAQFRGDDTRPDESQESGADKRTAFSFTADDGKERLFYVYETDDSSVMLSACGSERRKESVAAPSMPP